MPETSPRLPFEIDDTVDPTLVTGRAASKGTLLEMFYFSQILKVFSSDTGTALHRPTPLYTRFRRRASPMLRAMPHR